MPAPALPPEPPPYPPPLSVAAARARKQASIFARTAPNLITPLRQTPNFWVTCAGSPDSEGHVLDRLTGDLEP